MAHPDIMIRKLRHSTNLHDDDAEAIRSLPVHVKQLPADTPIVKEGDRPTQCCLMIEGYSARSKTTDQGKRQILSIHIPGDIPDLQSLHLHVMDHDFWTLSACTLGFISHEALRALTRARPLVAEALWRETLVDAAIFREWIVNLGRRAAGARLAHLVLEMDRRLATVGLAGNGYFEFPITQVQLADALGLTPVHVNRVLKELRADGVLDLHKHTVTLGDAEKLAKIADFDEGYLHQNPGL